MSRVMMMSTACMLFCFQSLSAQTVIRKDTSFDKRSVLQIIGSKNGMAGLAVSSATSPRDTNGLLVSSVTPGSAAEKAGLVEGNRIAAINGVNLKLHPSDASQTDMQGIMARRFQREMARVRLGDSVKLNVYADSRYRDVTVRTEAPQARKLNVLRNTPEDMNRATLGAIIGGTATKRDTLGVLVLEIAENGPLAKNSIYEGSRIASIGGVDLRVPVASAGDEKLSAEKADLLVAELGKLTAGNRVELRVYDSGRYRNVSVETMRRGDVTMPPGSTGFFKLRGGGDNLMHLNELELPSIMLHMDRLNLDSTLQQIQRHVIEVPRVHKLEIEKLQESLKGMDLQLRQHLDTLRLNLPMIINGRRIAASK